MIVIIDYGVGNLASVQKGFARAGYDALITGDPEEVKTAGGLVLPGVGAFQAGMQNLNQRGFIPAIKRFVQENKPLLGICLGMQLLFEESEENGINPGLGILPGRVVKFNLPHDFKVPHMGWNQVKKKNSFPLFKGIPPDAYFYFVHSYYAVPSKDSLVGGVTDYGLDFPAAVGDRQVFGVQFHPEKSSVYGIQVLKNFGELVEHVNNSGD